MSYFWILTLTCLVTSTLCQMNVIDETENDSRISKMSEAIGRLESMMADMMTDNRKLKKLTSELARRLEDETQLRKQLEQRIGGQGHEINLKSWERGSRTDIGGDIPVFEASPKTIQKKNGKNIIQSIPLVHLMYFKQQLYTTVCTKNFFKTFVFNICLSNSVILVAF